jgi:hypothetical protein
MASNRSVLSGFEPRAFWEHFEKLTTIVAELPVAG